MTDESNIDLSKSSNNIDLEFFGGNNPIEKTPPGMEGEQKKPKRKYTKRKQKQGSESSGIGHKPAVHGSEGGSSVRLERERRKRFDKLQQELAAKLGELPEGIAGSKPRPRKSRKDKVRGNDYNKEIDVTNGNDESDSESDSDSDYPDCCDDYSYIVKGFIPFMRPNPFVCPQESVVNKIVNAFAGYPVATHVSQTSPNTSKLTIEIDI